MGEMITESNIVRKVMRFLRKKRRGMAYVIFLFLVLKDILIDRKPHKIFSIFPDMEAIVGLIVMGMGSSLRCWALGSIDKRQLTCSGPYAHIRHPLYLGSFLIMLGCCFILNHYLNFIVITLYFGLVYSSTIILEEEKLREKFGKAYAEYSERVPRFIPKLRSGTDRKEKGFSWKQFLHNGGITAIVELLAMITGFALIRVLFW